MCALCVCACVTEEGNELGTARQHSVGSIVWGAATRAGRTSNRGRRLEDKPAKQRDAQNGKEQRDQEEETHEAQQQGRDGAHALDQGLRTCRLAEQPPKSQQPHHCPHPPHPRTPRAHTSYGIATRMIASRGTPPQRHTDSPGGGMGGWGRGKKKGGGGRESARARARERETDGGADHADIAA